MYCGSFALFGGVCHLRLSEEAANSLADPVHESRPFQELHPDGVVGIGSDGMFSGTILGRVGAPTDPPGVVVVVGVVTVVVLLGLVVVVEVTVVALELPEPPPTI
jgi:hypothetical protein